MCAIILTRYFLLVVDMQAVFPVISQLADLFWQLEYCEAAAVTPTVELAKLALVTSRDEEEDEVDKGGTDSSNDTDATLVDDGPSRFPVSDQSPRSPRSPARSPGSVLGKRPRDTARRGTEMDIDSPVGESNKDKDSFVMVSPVHQSSSPPLLAESSSSYARETSTSGADKDGDVEMQAVPHVEEQAARKPPPLPPRKATEISSSIMMFGKIHALYEVFYVDKDLQANSMMWLNAWITACSKSKLRCSNSTG